MQFKLLFYSKNEATEFNNNVENSDTFKSFMYKSKLCRNTVAQSAPN